MQPLCQMGGNTKVWCLFEGEQKIYMCDGMAYMKTVKQTHKKKAGIYFVISEKVITFAPDDEP